MSRHVVDYKIDRKDFQHIDFIKEYELERYTDLLIEKILDSDEDTIEKLQDNELGVKIIELIRSEEYKAAEKIIELLQSSDYFDSDIEDSKDENTNYECFYDFDEKYLIIRAYITALYIYFPKKNIHEYSGEAIDNLNLSKYQKWLDEVYQELEPKKKIPSWSEADESEIFEDEESGYIDLSKFSFFSHLAIYSYSYTTINDLQYYPEVYPSNLFGYQLGDENSFKSAIQEILLNKAIFYRLTYDG